MMPREPAGPDRDTGVAGVTPCRDRAAERIGRAVAALASCNLKCAFSQNHDIALNATGGP